MIKAGWLIAEHQSLNFGTYLEFCEEKQREKEKKLQTSVKLHLC